MGYFTKRYHPPGTSPGTLQRIDDAKLVPYKLYLTDYTDTEFTEHDLATPEECRGYLHRESITWIHVQGDAEPSTLRELGALFGLHQLALEDVINTGQRPKVDDYNDQLFVVLAHPVVDSDSSSVSIAQLSLFAGNNFLVSFHPGNDDPFEPVRRRLRERSGRIRERSVDYLLYALIDLVVDEGFPVLEMLGETIEDLEDELLDHPTRDTLHRLHSLRRTMLVVRRMLWPQREVLNSLMRDQSGIILEENQLFYRDCYDHTIQIMDLAETYRDMIASLLDVYLSSISYRLNEIMRILTIIATIFIPLTFIVGVYGMNFANPASPWAMPELRWYFGYPMVWMLIIAVFVGMLIYFRRTKWL